LFSREDLRTLVGLRGQQGAGIAQGLTCGTQLGHLRRRNGRCRAMAEGGCRIAKSRDRAPTDWPTT
jgi:hypothetical protein